MLPDAVNRKYRSLLFGSQVSREPDRYSGGNFLPRRRLGSLAFVLGQTCCLAATYLILSPYTDKT
ncbi:MAG: hypothetical protein BGP14_12780 [Sphingobacteriales bacterium 44-15]|nr:MAG: hypothetical protein BGP14_12780 [Sphingobacteriales bacterium 44-15]